MMSRFWVFSLFYLQVIRLSAPVVLSPCRVNNYQTQPHFGTSLQTRAVVQIIQIPPVFMQNVLVGKCENKNEKTAGGPGEYFVCRQRYSAVEVYVTEEEEFHNNQLDPNAQDLSPAIEIFRKTHFVRDSVVVESGCDFTFNLLSLLQEGEKTNLQQIEQPHHYNFLKSPYHPVHPASLFQSAVTDSSQDLQQPSNEQHGHVNSHNQKEAQVQGGNKIHAGEKHQNKNPQFYNESQPKFNPNIIPAPTTNGKPSSDSSEQNKLNWQRLQLFVSGEDGHTSAPASQQPSTSPTQIYKQGQTPHVINSQHLGTFPSTHTHSPSTTELQSGSIRPQGTDTFISNPPAKIPGTSSLGYQSTTGQTRPSGSLYGALRERAEQEQNDDLADQLQSGDFQSNLINVNSYNPSTSGDTVSPSTEHFEFVPINGTSSKESANIFGGSGTTSGDDRRGGIISLSHPVISDSTASSNNLTNGTTPISESPEETGSLQQAENFINGGKETDLHNLSNKIGLPLLILYRKYDPLMNNVDAEGALSVNENPFD